MNPTTPVEVNPPNQKAESPKAAFAKALRACNPADAILIEGTAVKAGNVTFPDSPPTQALAALAKQLPSITAGLVQQAVMVGVFHRLTMHDGAGLVGLRNVKGDSVPIKDFANEVQAAYDRALAQAGIEGGVLVLQGMGGRKFAVLPNRATIDLDRLAQGHVRVGMRYQAYQAGNYIVPVPSKALGVGSFDQAPRGRPFLAQIRDAEAMLAIDALRDGASIELGNFQPGA